MASSSGLRLCCLAPHLAIFQLYHFSYFSFIDGGNLSTRRKPPSASHWQTLSHDVVSSTPRH